MNAADTVWILISSALVMLMTPGLALFYGGMARRNNLLSTIMMSFSALGVIGILWVLYGYSLAFAPDLGGFIGGLNHLGLMDVGQEPSSIYASTVPHLAFMVFQGMFAIITVALITGAVVERMKFSALLIFSILWLTLIYCPVAHWVWGDGGWLAGIGALDFAGGAVVHINAGVSALTLVILLGPRRSFPKKITEPNNIPMVVLGAGLLWFGWFGFNAGSALTADGLATSAFVATNISAASAAATWMVISWIHRRPSLLGVITGAVAGLVSITPAAGFVSPIAAVPIGIIAAFISYYSIVLIKTKLNIDDSLDVFAVHGMGGIWGALATGIFATLAVNPRGASGLIEGNGTQVLIQLVSIVTVAAFAFAGTWILARLIDMMIGLRVGQKEEMVGLDLSQHGERAYGGSLR
ncbi:MAG: ammonium transporter [Dehalococcoidia bacterium]|nr:MAG: ammonium transporter [Dehalococcoidia bacterium]